MSIGIFTLFRKIYGLNLEYHAYLILGGLIFGELIFGGEFVLVSRGAYIRGGLIFGGGLILRILRYIRRSAD